MNRCLVRVFLGILLASFSSSPPAEAQDAAERPSSAAEGARGPEERSPNLTDPTEPTTIEPVIRLPAGSKGDGGEEDEVEDLSIPGDPWGDVGTDGLLSLRAMFRMRYISTFSRDSQNMRESYRVREDWLAAQDDGFSLNRVYLRIGSDPSRYLGFKAVIDFSQLIDNDPEDVVKQAYATFRPFPKHLEIVAGQFKVPFSVLELDASSRFEFTDFGQSNWLINRLGFAGRDLGVQVLVAPFKKAKRLRITLGAFRGHAYGEHASPIGSLGGRIETKPNKRLRFGASVLHQTKDVSYRRPFSTSNNDVALNPPDPLYPNSRTWSKGTAYAVDARYKRKGFMLRGEGIYGDRVDHDERYTARTFYSVWGIVAYRFDVRRVQLLPAIRYEWFDANLEQDIGIFTQASAALNVIFLERARVVIDVTATDVQDNTPFLNQRRPLQADPYLALDSLRGTIQLQIEL